MEIKDPSTREKPYLLLLALLPLISAFRTSLSAQSDQIQLPRQIAWTAYNLGSTGYNQAVAIGAMLREKYDVTLRVIPGQNDVSRLLPLKMGQGRFYSKWGSHLPSTRGNVSICEQRVGPSTPSALNDLQRSQQSGRSRSR